MATKTKLHSPAFAEIFTRKSRKGTFMLCMLMFMTLIAYSQGTWTALTNLAPNNNQGVLFLLSDGTVLCKTGVGGTGATAYGNLYNRLTPNSSGSYVNGTWSSIAPMADDRRFYSSQILQDGRMYVCGGEYGTGGSLGEIYNPVTNTWSSIPAPGGFVSDANSEILEDGQILQAIVGGGSQTVKLYNPATNTFSAAANTIGSHNECTWHKLNDGSILMVPKNSTQSTRYFPATNTWANDGVIPVQLYSDFGSETGGAAMLPDGRIWFVGGKEKTAFYTPSGTSAAGTWTAGPDIPNQYGQADGPVSVLRDGKVLFTCSPKPFAGAGNVFNTPTRFYEFDPIANTYTLLTAPNGAANLPSNTCYQTNFVNLPNGQILYGLMGTNQYYVYTPAGSASASWKPVITANSLSSGNFCNTYRIRGIRFNGISLGSVYGDDWQMNTNWPIVKIGNLYARSFNWNSTGVDRGSAPDTVDFTLPAGLANGSYALTVTANGITSNSITFTTYPNMTSDVTPTAICSGHTFSYTPTYDRSCVSDTWTRAAVAGISNAAITTPQTSNPNEILYNTTSSPIAVTYAYSMTHNGYSTTQNVVVTVNPSPTVTTSATSTSLCLGESTTITASGAVTYAWDPGTSTGSSVVFTPTSTTTYTVTGTNIYGCTDQATRKVYVNSNPTVVTSVVDEELCAGSNQSTTISVGANQTINSIQTTMAGGNGNQGNAFDIHAYNSITITDFKMNITSGDSAEVWYNPGGYGNADITSNTGWTRLGARVAITPAGSGFLTTIPTTANLTIPAGSTYGIIVICNGSNNYTNGTLVGSIEASNLDLYITEGHGGSGFGTTFNFLNSPRIFNGTVEYRTNLTDYLWTPSSTLSSATVSNPTATPTSTTNYTVTVTDGNGCTGTSVAKVYVYTKPVITGTTATPSSICAGASSQLNVTHGTSTTTQNLFTTLDGGNSFSGNVFDVHALNSINITNVRMHILSGDSAQVWYKAGGYGGANLSSNIGWTKLGNTVAVTPQGAGALTLISTTANLFISAGQTYGIAVVSNGSVSYTNGTAVGAIAYDNPDLEIMEGHGGSGFNGTFSFLNSPRVFNGQLDYTVTNSITNYSWSPINDLNNGTLQNPVANPYFNTNYRVLITDVHGCRDTAFQNLYVNKLPSLNTTVSPVTICPGDSAQLNVTANVFERDSLLTTTANDNGSGGSAFDIITTKSIVIRGFKMNIGTGATLAEVWYKAGGYGNANFTGTAGWTKLGATVAITPAGVGALTTIPITANLTLPAGATYGFMVVCNGTAYYTNSASPVGTVYVSNPDMSITIGHGGTGIGAYSFTNSPRVYNGEVTYDAVNSISGYVWTPNTNMNNAFISNPKASPLSTSIYSVTATDINGCTSVASAGVVVSPLPTLGTATASPSSLCLGGTTNLTYTQPAGTSCYGAVQSSFAGTYAPANWSTTQSPLAANGTVNTAGAPANIVMTSSNGAVGGGSGTTSYTITVPCSGIISFDWSYTSVDGAQYDYPKYSINGAAGTIFPGYIAQSGAPSTQSGVFNLAVTAGQTFSFQAYSSDNVGGSCTITITNFKAPYQTTAGQSVVWYSAAVGGSNLGNGNPQSLAPATAGAFTYYAQVTSSVTGCTNTSRAATNTVTVNPIPTVGASASPATICQGSSTTLTGTGATTYSWQPGGLSGTSVSVSPATTTTYTVTGTNSAGCTATSTVLVTVLPAAAVTGSATPGIVCPGGAVTLTGTNAGATFNWQPGNLNGTPVVVNPVAQTTYTVTATYGNGCSRTATFVILMNPVPTVTISSAPPSATICAGSSATFTASSATATGYTWQPGGGVGANLIVTLANTYTVTATNAQGCTGTATQQLIVNNLPTVGASASPATICQGSSTTLTGSGATTYSWQPGGLSGSSVSVSPATTTTYTVTGTNAAGCTATSTVLVTVNPAAAVAGSATPGIVCPGGAVTLTGTNAGATFNWQPGNLNGTPVVVNPVAQTTYTVTATYGNGCSRTATFTILMNPVPTVTISSAPPSATICAGSSATFTASSATATGYTWQPGGGVGANLIVTLANTYTVTATNAQGCTGTATKTLIVNSLPTVGTTVTNATICVGQSTSITGTGASTYTWQPGALSGTTINVSPASTTTYTVTGTNASGCTATATRLITVNSLPTATASATLTTIPCGGSTTLSATGGVSYSWQPGGMSGSSVVVSPGSTTTYTVTATNASGCTATATRTITVNPGCGTTVNIKLYIEGYYLGAGLMTPVMQNQGVAGATGTQTDTITVQLRNSTAPYAVAATQKVILNTNGTATCNFSVSGTYYLAVLHRNAVQTWSSTTVTLSGGSFTYDFSNAITKAYGSNQATMGGGVFAFYSGDLNADENIDLADFTPLDFDIVNFASGYYNTDINGDGNVDILDAPIVEANAANFIFSDHP